MAAFNPLHRQLGSWYCGAPLWPAARLVCTYKQTNKHYTLLLPLLGGFREGGVPYCRPEHWVSVGYRGRLVAHCSQCSRTRQTNKNTTRSYCHCWVVYGSVHSVPCYRPSVGSRLSRSSLCAGRLSQRSSQTRKVGQALYYMQGAVY